MFRSIRWRLILSYVLLTVLTVGVVGFLAIFMVNGHLRQQEEEELRVQAGQIARHAYSFFIPSIRRRRLEELAASAGFVGDFRVEILDSRRNVIVDSQQEPGKGSILYLSTLRLHVGAPSFSLVAIDRLNEISGLDESISRLLEQFGADSSTLVIRKQWGRGDSLGPKLVIESLEQLTGEQRQSSGGENPGVEGVASHMRVELHLNPLRLLRGRRGSEEPGQEGGTVTVTVAVGRRETPLGFVRLSSERRIHAVAALVTRRAFLFAAIAAVLVAAAFGFLMGRGMTDGLEELMTAVSRMENGDLSARAAARGRDEIGKLSRQFNRMARQLEVQFREIESERDTLRRFVADASHELRTPLTALRTFIDLLRSSASSDPEAQREFLTESAKQVERLEWITRNLLDLSRLDAGLVDLAISECDARQIVKDTIASFAARAAEKSLVMQISLPPRQLPLRCDKKRMEMALANLVTNAIKFTDSGGRIAVGVAPFRDGGIRFWVQDTGRGIRAEDLDHIFDRFFRAADAPSDGSGLGLAIVRSIVELHGGRVLVQSVLGGGATFTMHLPRSGSDSVSHGEPS